MKRVKKMISILLTFVLLFSLFSVDAYAKSKKVTLTISAAASLAGVTAELSKEYAKEYPNVKLVFNYGSSGALQQQIEQGSPVDVFISAATKQVDTLKSEKLLVDSTIKTLTYNDLVLVVPQDTKLSIRDFDDLGKDGVKTVALGDPSTVPAGAYGTEVLTYYGVLDKVKKKAVYGKDVTEVLTWVAGGNADAGIVYYTDALSTNKVKVVAKAPANSHTAVAYPAAVVKDSKHITESKQFLTFLVGSKAKKIFKKFGFKTI